MAWCPEFRSYNWLPPCTSSWQRRLHQHKDEVCAALECWWIPNVVTVHKLYIHMYTLNTYSQYGNQRDSHRCQCICLPHIYTCICTVVHTYTHLLTLWFEKIHQSINNQHCKFVSYCPPILRHKLLTCCSGDRSVRLQREPISLKCHPSAKAADIVKSIVTTEDHIRDFCNCVTPKGDGFE